MNVWMCIYTYTYKQADITADMSVVMTSMRGVSAVNFITKVHSIFALGPAAVVPLPLNRTCQGEKAWLAWGIVRWLVSYIQYRTVQSWKEGIDRQYCIYTCYVVEQLCSVHRGQDDKIDYCPGDRSPR